MTTTSPSDPKPYRRVGHEPRLISGKSVRYARHRLFVSDDRIDLSRVEVAR